MTNIPKFKNKQTGLWIYGREEIEALTNAAYAKETEIQFKGKTLKLNDLGRGDEWIIEVLVV